MDGVKKNYKLIGAVVLLLAVIVVGFIPVTVFAANPVSITVTQSFTTTQPLAADSFTYRFSALDPANPMPEGSGADGYEFTLEGNASAEIGPITYEAEGIFEYEITQVVNAPVTGYEYDTQVYTVSVYAYYYEGTLDTQVIVENEANEKVSDITFANAYTVEPPVVTTPPIEVTTPPVQTPEPTISIEPSTSPPTNPPLETLTPVTPQPPTFSPTEEVTAPPTALPTISPTIPPSQETFIPEISPTPIVDVIGGEGVPVIEIGDEPFPLAPGSQTGMVWALVNLILAIAGAVLTVITAIRSARRRKQEEEEEEENAEAEGEQREEEVSYYQPGMLQRTVGRTDGTSAEPVTTETAAEGEEEDEEDEKKQKRVRAIWLALAVIMGVGGIVFFLLTEDIRLPMVLVDKWTIWSALIFIGEVVSDAFVIRRKKDESQDDDEDENEEQETGTEDESSGEA